MEKTCVKHYGESSSQLKLNGLKITPARLRLLDIFKHAKKPLNVKEIAAKFKKTDVDQATLYRNLEALENLGFINQIHLGGSEGYFELAGNHHHHLICQNCGKIMDVNNCMLNLPKASINKSGFAQITHHSLEFFGLCKTCAK